MAHIQKEAGPPKKAWSIAMQKLLGLVRRNKPTSKWAAEILKANWKPAAAGSVIGGGIGAGKGLFDDEGTVAGNALKGSLYGTFLGASAKPLTKYTAGAATHLMKGLKDIHPAARAVTGGILGGTAGALTSQGAIGQEFDTSKGKGNAIALGMVGGTAAGAFAPWLLLKKMPSGASMVTPRTLTRGAGILASLYTAPHVLAAFSDREGSQTRSVIQGPARFSDLAGALLATWTKAKEDPKTFAKLLAEGAVAGLDKRHGDKVLDMVQNSLTSAQPEMLSALQEWLKSTRTDTKDAIQNVVKTDVWPWVKKTVLPTLAVGATAGVAGALTADAAVANMWPDDPRLSYEERRAREVRRKRMKALMVLAAVYGGALGTPWAMNKWRKGELPPWLMNKLPKPTPPPA